jgi:hypothetical protein
LLPRAELQALVEKACPELVCRPATTSNAEQLRGLREEIVEGLESSTMATVWQRLHDAGKVRCSVITFRRFVRRELWEVDPDKVTVRRPPAKLGDTAEIDFGVLGMWLDPLTQQRRRLWAFVMTLAASRHMFVRPVWRLDLRAWITCHVDAFDFFGAVPRRLVVDYVDGNIIDFCAQPSYRNDGNGDSDALAIPSNPAPNRRGAGSRGLPHGTATAPLWGEGYLVLRASHHEIALAARLSRVVGAEPRSNPLDHLLPLRVNLERDTRPAVIDEPRGRQGDGSIWQLCSRRCHLRSPCVPHKSPSHRFRSGRTGGASARSTSRRS